MKLSKAHIPEYIQKNFNKYKYVLLICAVGLLLAAWPTAGPRTTGEAATQSGVSDLFPETQALEQSLEETLSQIDGVGRVQVMLTVKSGNQSVYAYDSRHNESRKTGSDSAEITSEEQKSMVFSGGSSQTPVTIRTDGPQYQGIVIVCDGADRATIQLELTEAVRALTGISSDCISVLKMKQ